MLDKKHEEIDWGELFSGQNEPKRNRMTYRSKPFPVRVEPEVQIEVVLHGMMGQCCGCGEWKPASEFGMLTPNQDRKGRLDLIICRNQPRCTPCRQYKTKTP